MGTRPDRAEEPGAGARRRGMGAPRAGGAEALSREVPWSQDSVKPREKSSPLRRIRHQAWGHGLAERAYHRESSPV